MNNQTYFRPELSQLAYHYQNDETADYIAEKVLPFKSLSIEKGSFRAPDEATYFNQQNMKMSRTGVPNSFSFTDSNVNYDMAPYGGSFEFSNLELSQAEQLGYAGKSEMIRTNVEWMAARARLDLEIRFAEFMQTESLYAAGFVTDINASSTKWSTLNTSDPLADIMTYGFEKLWGTPTDMIIGKKMLWNLMQHPKVTGSSTVTGNKRPTLDPKVTPEYLQNYFGIKNVWVAGGIYNTAPNTPDTMTKGYIWDEDYVWIGVLDKSTALNPKVQTFANALALKTPELKVGNFIANETVDPRAGGVGMHFWDIVFYMQYKTRMQKLGVLFTNCY